MKNNTKLTNALLTCLSHCEELGVWSDNGDDMVAPIDGEVFRDCADFCTLALRLSLRSRLSKAFIECVIEQVELCHKSSLNIYEEDYLPMDEERLIEIIADFEIALNDIRLSKLAEGTH